MTTAGFEPARANTLVLETSPLDPSGKLSINIYYYVSKKNLILLKSNLCQTHYLYFIS